jgi:hypothetical protein
MPRVYSRGGPRGASFGGPAAIVQRRVGGGGAARCTPPRCGPPSGIRFTKLSGPGLAGGARGAGREKHRGGARGAAKRAGGYSEAR